MKVLLVIDVQRGLTKRRLYNKEGFLSSVNCAIEKFSANGDTVVFVQHQNKQLVLGTDDWQIDERLTRQSTNPVFAKQKGNAFMCKALVAFLEKAKPQQVVVCGLVTHGCVKHTCLGGQMCGFNMALLRGAHTCYNTDAADKICTTEKELATSGVSLIDVEMI